MPRSLLLASPLSCLFASALFVLVPLPAVAADDAAPAAAVDLPAQALAALARSTDFMRSIATEGGYLWRYSPDLAERAGEGKATATQIWVQSPGTPAVGRAFLRAYEVTHEVRYLEAARAAALALVRGQLESGGWDYQIDFDPAQRVKIAYRDGDSTAPGKRFNNSTYDDDDTQGALRYLMVFLHAARASPSPDDDRVREALDYGLGKLLVSQYPIGAWPQRWNGKAHDPALWPVKAATLPADYPLEQPKSGYYHEYTLNDGAHRDLIRTLIEAHKHTGRAEYLAAAKRGAEFLLLAQLPEPQRGWAQQYNAAMEPAWARAFEPPSVTAGESSGAARLLADLYVEWGDERLLVAAESAVAWFRRSEITPKWWARLYELHTNTPIYGDRDGRIHRELAGISAERRQGYAWEGRFDIPETIAYVERIRATGREAALTALKAPAAPGGASRIKKLEPRVRSILAALDDQGRWLRSRAPGHGDDVVRPWIQTELFIANAAVLCDFVEVTR